jgi:formate hydrogenlyase subunit 3/multisubunit Na+/H+ antiporter MnhD subunit
LVQNDLILCVPVLLPLIAGFIILFLPSKLSVLFRALTLIISIVTFVLAIVIFISGDSQFSWSVLTLPEGGFNLALLLKVTALGKFILLFAMGFGFLISLYSLRARTAADEQRNSDIYYGSILLAIGGSAGILLSNHLLFLLIFWEIVTASLYLLITTGGKSSNFAATKSFAMIGASDAAFMLGVFIIWSLSRTFVISDISIATTSALPVIAFLLLMTAAITKAGAMPMHTWVPASGEYAPASVMALLPAALDKLLGIYLLVIIVRSMFDIGHGALTLLLTIIGAVTIIAAVMMAMVQHNLKKLLSYHAVSQVGYMILGIATGTPVGIAGGVFHMLNNAIYKSCLFLCGGAVEQQTGTADLEELGGLGKKMPWTFTTCLIAALSISGIPPLNGFVSKWMIYQGVIQMGREGAGSTTAGLWPVWLVAAMFGSALTLASFVKLIHSMFLSRMPNKLKEAKEVSALQIIPMVVLAGLCVIFGIVYYFPLRTFIYPSLGLEIAPALSLWNAGLATILIIIGIIIGLILWLMMKLSDNIRVVPTWNCGEKQNSDKLIVPGTHFYKTVSSMNGLKPLYSGQEKGYFDVYNQSGRLGLSLTGLLRWLHSGILPMYLTWVTVGLLALLFALCKVW